MKSSWNRVSWGGHDAPVEMRFIDLFMTALGSLLFFAILLIYLLSQNAGEEIAKDIINALPPHMRPASVSNASSPKEQVAAIIKSIVGEHTKLENNYAAALDALLQADKDLMDIRKLVDDMSQRLQNALGKSEDKEIVKRSLVVVLNTRGCPNWEPRLYVRWEGAVVDELDQPLPPLAPFDASDPIGSTSRPIKGYHYSRINLPSPNYNDLIIFSAVMRGLGPVSVYVALVDPKKQGSRPCIINPYYIAGGVLVLGDEISLAQQRPFAWLRRITVNLDGTPTTSASPRYDESFKRELAEFSAAQRGLLCKRLSLCDVGDAHLASIISQNK